MGGAGYSSSVTDTGAATAALYQTFQGINIGTGQTYNYLPWIVAGVLLVMLLRR